MNRQTAHKDRTAEFDGSRGNRILPRWLVHLLIWLLGSVFILLAFALDEELRPLFVWIFVASQICSVILFYVNYCFLVSRYWTQRRYALFALLNIAALLLSMFLLYESYVYIYGRFGNFTDAPETFPVIIPLFLAIAYLPTGMFVILLSSLIKTSFFWNQSQARLKELENERMKAELEGLKSQINPHFLFNSLNAIYALIAMDGDKAQEATHALSNLLRYVLNEKNEEMVPLKDELKFTREYIDLMSLRFSNDMLSLKVELPDNTEGYMIAPMLFMMLIENAFKHGISNASPSFILILMHISDGKITATIANSVAPKKGEEKHSGGIGLENLKRRLELIYGSDASLDVKQEDGAYTAHLEIPLRK